MSESCRSSYPARSNHGVRCKLLKRFDIFCFTKLMRPRIKNLVRLALDGDFVFHGSPDSFDALKPSRTERWSAGRLDYEGVSAHASRALGVAISYMASKRFHADGYKTGVNLKSTHFDRRIAIIGPTESDLESSMKKLYGRGGYIYAFDATDFEFRKGLGVMEVATFKSLVPKHKFRVTHQDFLELVELLGITMLNLTADRLD